MSEHSKCGHPQTDANTQDDGQRERCAECHRVRERQRYYRLKGIRLTVEQFARTGRKRAA